jgi:hypothetical protein
VGVGGASADGAPEEPGPDGEGQGIATTGTSIIGNDAMNRVTPAVTAAAIVLLGGAYIMVRASEAAVFRGQTGFGFGPGIQIPRTIVIDSAWPFRIAQPREPSRSAKPSLPCPPIERSGTTR